MSKRCCAVELGWYRIFFLIGVLFLSLYSITFGQNQLRGVVTDSLSGETLPGVNIVLKGTTTGTTTNAEGAYELSIPSLKDTLVFSFIGYQTLEVPIGGRSVVNVTMQSEAIAGDEVVVVGYGTQRSEDVTGSVGTVSLDEIDEQPLTGPDQLLTGQISGVQVTQPAGVPGGGTQIQVRGVGAIGAGGQPLYVIDGFPVPSSSSVVSNPLTTIPTEDIESISVLKDASATAIYGSRGANGVVLIETKSGQAGNMRVQINAYTAIQQIPRKGRPDLMNAREFAQFRKEAIEDQIRYEENREPVPEDIPEAYRNPAQYGEGTNWLEEITRIAPMRNLIFNIGGGSESIRAYISGGYLSQKGVVIGTDFERFSFRANVDAELNENINVGLRLAPSFTQRSTASIGGQGRAGGLGHALVASPIPPVYEEDGSYNVMINSPGTFNYPNPVMGLNEVDDNSQGLRGLLSGFVQYDVVESLSLKSSVNVDYSNSRNRYFHPSTIGNENIPPPVIPSGSYGDVTLVNWANENTISYENEFGRGHTVNGLVGFSIQHNNASSANFNGENFPDDDIRTLNAAARITGETAIEDWALVSYLARLNYNYRDKYLVTGTIRRDGSSRFGSQNRWGLFPSGAIGWRISEEPFMADISSVSELKLRVSYGITGNFNIGNYTHLSQVGTNDYVFGGSLAPGRSLNSLGNMNLGWERTREINIGLDVGLWNDRLLISAELYKRNTEDLLLDVEIPQSSGFTNVTVNRGDVENRGLELAVTSRNITQNYLSWTTDFNIAFNRNSVLALGQGGDPILSGLSGEGNPTHITQIGEPVGMFYGYVFEGIYQSESEISNGASFPGAIPGNIRYRDINGDENITPVDDYTIIGSPYPDFIWGMTNSFSYQNLGLNVLITGSYGGERLRASNEYLHNIDGVFNVTRDIQNRWRSPEQPGDGRTPTTNGTGRGRVLFRDVSSLWVEDNTHLWIKNVTVSYNFSDLLSSETIRDVSLYASVQNALLLSRYDGNPQVENYGNERFGGALAPGVDYSNYPVPRVITLGLKLGL